MAAFATVYEVRDSEAVIQLGNGTRMTMGLPVSHNLSIGDVVEIDEQDGNFLDLVAENGLERGNSVAVVEEVLEEDVLVNKNGVITKVANPENRDVRKGNTVELTGADTIRSVLSEEPVSSLSTPP